MNEKEAEGDNHINITLPLKIINEMLYSKTFVKETDPIYDKELRGKAMIAGKNVTLLKFRPKVKLKQIKINPTNGRAKLYAQASLEFSPTAEENNQEEYPDDIAKAKNNDVDADVDISIDQNKGRIQINPKYALLEAKIAVVEPKTSSDSGGENEPEAFCQLAIPLQLKKLKVELPLGVSGFKVPFQAPINKTFSNSGTEFPIRGEKQGNGDIVFRYPLKLEEQQK